ncbi:hypothetical protein GY45DRAFT_1327922 [Cubamyces sp. BRFM 1775]|nr:hypothetical protein GY45DRAFT_1327922 [Cubamyces sp. BRFM 1775]
MSSVQQSPELYLSGLRPTTPVLTCRYDSKKQSTPSNMIITPGLFSYAREKEPSYLPLGWSPYVQPEGQVYFAFEGNLKFVTDAYLYTRESQDRVVRFTKTARKAIEALQVTIPATAEIYLLPYDDEDCGYYIVDHATHTVSWLEAVDLDQLGIPDVVSDSHLRYALEELYWQHIEQFPSHRLQHLSLAVDDLIAIFIHGEGDHLTSSNSTFPYVAKECKQFIRVLEAAKQRLDQSPSVCIVARLWSVVSRHRLQTHYAQERARLSRDQLILDRPEPRRGIMFAGASRALFGIPRAYSESLKRLFSDEIVYVNPWRDFMRGCREEWQQYLTWSLGLSILNALSLTMSQGSATIGHLSLACCAMTLLSSLFLLLRFNDAHQWCADQAAAFLSSRRDASSGYRPTALAFAAPKAAFIWAAFLASLQTLVWLERATNAYALAAMVGVAVLVALPWSRWVHKTSSILPRWRSEAEPEGIFKV